MRLSRLFGGGATKDAAPVRSGQSAGPTGCRCYAIGDVHGRLDLARAMIDTIAADIAARPRLRTFVTFLGDLVDRGPHSREVVEFLRLLRPRDYELVFLMGNHEEIMLRVLDGETSALEQWFEFGGRECARSYGVPDLARASYAPSDVARDLRRAVPPAHVAFLRALDDSFTFGDYVLVHAGVRPGVPLADQHPDDLRWIREDFLDSDHDHGFVAVHGHTVVAEPEERANRIGVDTGAYHSGRLTALVIEGTDRRFLTVADR